MQITERIHALKIPFKIPVAPTVTAERSVYVYLVFGARLHLIDSGVAGAASLIAKYIAEQGRKPEELATLILTHAHPDHIGAAKSIKDRTGCTIIAHKYERLWIEDTEQQLRARPVPGFKSLVEGPVGVDGIVEGGEVLELEKGLACRIIHVPGHSSGSSALLFEKEKSLFTGDALAFPGDLPIYEDIAASLTSLAILQKIKNIDFLFSSWEPPMQGKENIKKRMDESVGYLKRIHTAVIDNRSPDKEEDIMMLCRRVVTALGLPPFAVNPLVAKAFASSLAAEQD